MPGYTPTQLTTTSLARRLDELPANVPLFIYAGARGSKFHVAVQAEPLGDHPLIVLQADIDVSGGGAIHELDPL